jgi:hypothetical protein
MIGKMKMIIDEWENGEINNNFDSEVDQMVPDRDQNVKNVTIRGIETETYEEFSKTVKMLDMNLGEAISKMMQDVLDNFNGTFPDISAGSLKSVDKLKNLDILQHDELEVSNEDLIQANARVSFYNIGQLNLSSDITLESFNKYVNRIMDCKTIRIPKEFKDSIPKLVLLSKINHYTTIEIYDQKSDTIIEQITNIERKKT